MGRFDPRPGEESFPDSGADAGASHPFIRSSAQFPGGTYPAADDPQHGVRVIRDQEAAKTDAREEAADMRLQAHGMAYQRKQEGQHFAKSVDAERSKGGIRGLFQRKTGDAVTDSAQDLVAIERRAAFAYGLGEIASRLGNISHNQGDLFAASTRRYPQGSGGGGGQWRPQRGVRERQIG